MHAIHKNASTCSKTSWLAGIPVSCDGVYRPAVVLCTVVYRRAPVLSVFIASAAERGRRLYSGTTAREFRLAAQGSTLSWRVGRA